MEYINKVEIRGRVGRASVTQVNEKKQLRISVYTERAYINKDGEAVCEPQWFNVTAFEGKRMADFESVQKGSVVHLFGRIRTIRYTDTYGNDRVSTEIIADKLEVVYPE